MSRDQHSQGRNNGLIGDNTESRTGDS